MVDDDKPIQLGLEEVTRPQHSDTVPQNTVGASQSTSPADPLRTLFDAGSYRAIITQTEPLLEGLQPSDLTREKLWWLRASVILGIPEPFLLGSVSEVPANSVARHSELGALLAESVLALHTAGAVLLASELSRIVSSDVAAATVSRPESAAQQAPVRKTREPIPLRTIVLILLVVFSGAGIAAYRAGLLSWAPEGEIASHVNSTLSNPPPAALSPPALAPVAPPSALDKVLVAIESKSRSAGSNPQPPSSVQSPAAQMGDASASTGGRSTAQKPAAREINWDGPAEPEEVRKAIEEGDPTDSASDDTARRLFGDPPPAMRRPERSHSERSQEAEDPPDRDDPQGFGRLIEYEAMVRTIASREPKFTSPKVIVLEPGDRIFVDQKDGAFLRVRLASGGTAYVLEQDMEQVRE